jgi:hypothetical protein
MTVCDYCRMHKLPPAIDSSGWVRIQPFTPDPLSPLLSPHTPPCVAVPVVHATTVHGCSGRKCTAATRCTSSLRRKQWRRCHCNSTEFQKRALDAALDQRISGSADQRGRALPRKSRAKQTTAHGMTPARTGARPACFVPHARPSGKGKRFASPQFSRVYFILNQHIKLPWLQGLPTDNEHAQLDDWPHIVCDWAHSRCWWKQSCVYRCRLSRPKCMFRCRCLKLWLWVLRFDGCSYTMRDGWWLHLCWVFKMSH